MKNKIRIFWDAIVAFICKVPYDKLLYFIAGLIIAAIFALPLHMKACLVPVVFVAFCKKFFDAWTTDKWEWWDFGAACIGGAVIQILAILA